jgi:hypothetical protein
LFIEIAVILFLPSFIAIFYLKSGRYAYLELLIANALILTIIDFSLSLQYFLPALIVGGGFGFLIKRKINGYYIVLLLSLLESLLLLVANQLTLFITDVDVFKWISLLVAGEGNYRNVVPLLALLFGLIQAVIVCFIGHYEIKKWNYHLQFSKLDWWYGILIAISIVISIILSVVNFFLAPFFSIVVTLMMLPYLFVALTSTKYKTYQLLVFFVLIFPSIYLLSWLAPYPQYGIYTIYPLLLANMIFYYVNTTKNPANPPVVDVEIL